MDKLLALLLSLQFMLPVIEIPSWPYQDIRSKAQMVLNGSEPDYYDKLTIGTLWEQKLSEVESRPIALLEIPKYSHSAFEAAYNLPARGLSLDNINLSNKEKSNLESFQNIFDKHRKEFAYSPRAHEKNESRVALFLDIMKLLNLKAPDDSYRYSLLADGVLKLAAGTCLDFSSLLTQEAHEIGLRMCMAMTHETTEENTEIESNHAFNIFISDNREAFASDLTYGICEEKDGKSVCFLIPLKNYIDKEFLLKKRKIDSYSVFVDKKTIPLPEFLHQNGVNID